MSDDEDAALGDLPLDVDTVRGAEVIVCGGRFPRSGVWSTQTVKLYGHAFLNPLESQTRLFFVLMADASRPTWSAVFSGGVSEVTLDGCGPSVSQQKSVEVNEGKSSEHRVEITNVEREIWSRGCGLAGMIVKV